MTSREEYEQYAESIGCVLGKRADKIIQMVINNDGKCPCKLSSNDCQQCPCPDHIAEIQDFGHCTCNLFLKGE